MGFLNYISPVSHTVNGGWSSYTTKGVWSACSRTCNEGVQTLVYKRTCTNPAPQNGGLPCLGESTMNKTRSCMTIKCPGVFLNLIYTQNEGCVRTQSIQICNYMYLIYTVSIYNQHDAVNILVYACTCITLEHNL